MEWVALTAPGTLKYCLRHRMDYRLLVGDIHNYDGRHGHWTVPEYIRDFMRMGYQYIIYMDADAFVVDHAVDLRDACAPDMIGAVWHNLSYHEPDWSHFNVGMLYVHNTTKTRAFVDEWLSKYPGKPDFPWWEQGEFNKLGKLRGVINHLDNKWNAGHVSPSDQMVVWGLHGIPDRLDAMRKAVESVKS
jgi:hypothetical protein